LAGSAFNWKEVEFSLPDLIFERKGKNAGMKARFAKFVLIPLVVLPGSMLTLRVSRGVSVQGPPGHITPTGKMTNPRFSHTATLLPNGMVLLVGGMARNGVVEANAEIYDPSTSQFTYVGKLNATRGWGTTATLLSDGKVLISGGASGSWCATSCILSSAELYDPANRKFAPTGSMTSPRASASAVLLQTGDVLIVGGNIGDTSTATAELYHPSAGTFTPTGSMHTPRDYFAAVLLKDGKVLVLGGSSNGQSAGGTVEEKTAEVYDPSTGRFSPAGDMSSPRNKLGAALLTDGRVLVVGGQAVGPFGARLATTEIFSPASGSFSPGPNMSFQRFKNRDGVVALKNGRILLSSGAEQPELYDPASNSFLPTSGEKLDSFYFSTSTLLPNGQVLIAGGYGRNPSGGGLNHAWLYQP
jgi:hypothetical protein